MDTLKVVVSGQSMWPNLNDGDTIDCIKYESQEIILGDIIIFYHPFNSSTVLVKRVKKVRANEYWVVGDNPDPTSSEDSHNFGYVGK